MERERERRRGEYFLTPGDGGYQGGGMRESTWLKDGFPGP